MSIIISSSINRIRHKLFNMRLGNRSYIVEIKGLKSNLECVRAIRFDKIVEVIEKYNKNSKLHFIVNERINRSDKVLINISEV